MVERKGAQQREPDQLESERLAPQPEEAPNRPGQSPTTTASSRASVAEPATSTNGSEKRQPSEMGSPTLPTGTDGGSTNGGTATTKITSKSKAPVFDLSGTESDSNAVVLGDNVLPAMPDDRFRNRPPTYPREAELRGDHGTVVVLIHVSETGLATRVELLQSSGVSVLDQATVNAVHKWHFRPAMRGGRAVPFTMPFRFIFDDP